MKPEDYAPVLKMLDASRPIYLLHESSGRFQILVCERLAGRDPRCMTVGEFADLLGECSEEFNKADNP